MKWMLALALAAIPEAALAGSYRVVLAPPPGGRLLVGHGGVQAADDRTQSTLVRVITPGNEVTQRGTVRVLAMNLGPTPFEFGPEQVTLTLGDGTVLRPVPVDTMEKGRELVERESSHAAAVDLRVKSNLDTLARESTTGITSRSIASVASPTATQSGPSLGQDRRSDLFSLPGGETLNAIYQILVPLTVDPAHAWGGYYVFDLPKTAFARRTDQPLSIVVRTGREEHRFNATLKWK